MSRAARFAWWYVRGFFRSWPGRGWVAALVVAEVGSHLVGDWMLWATWGLYLVALLVGVSYQAGKTTGYVRGLGHGAEAVHQAQAEVENEIAGRQQAAPFN